MSNKDLLKQAIAEAKTIREAAIANAKEALEETLTPHLKEMLAQKLQEMEIDEEEVLDENIYEADEEEVEAEEGEEEAEEGAEEEAEEEDDELDPEDPDFEKELKDFIRKTIAQEIGQGEEEELGAGEEGPEAQDDMISIDSDDEMSEEIDINELLAELEGMDEEVEETTEEGDLDEMVDQAPELWHVLVGIGAIAGSALGYGKWHVKAIAGELGTKMKKLARALEAEGRTAYAIAQQKESAEVQEDLNEALKAVKILRNQLQEVNLLNAKLLYVNKVFKSNNLSEGQKVNVIAAFDKAETVKEVKLVFETVSKNVVAKPAAIKEHRSFASKATGNAKTTAPKEIISEVSEQVARWQKLAGIIKS